MSTDKEGFSISFKSLLSVSAILALLIGEYVVLHKEIEEAKRLPKNEISIEEYKYDKKYLIDEIEELKAELELIINQRE